MTRKSYPSDLIDAQWKRIEPLVPPTKPAGRHEEPRVAAIGSQSVKTTDRGGERGFDATDFVATKPKGFRKGDLAASGTCSLIRWDWCLLRWFYQPTSKTAMGPSWSSRRRPLTSFDCASLTLTARTAANLSNGFVLCVVGRWRSFVGLLRALCCCRNVGLWRGHLRGFINIIGCRRTMNIWWSRVNLSLMSP